MSELKQVIGTALQNVIEQLDAEFCNREIFAFVFYVSSGYESIGVAFGTESWLREQPVGEEPNLDPDILEMLNEHPDLMRQVQSHRRSKYYYQVNAFEWDHQNPFSSLFDSANDLIRHRDSEESIETILTELLLNARNSGLFDSQAFAEDVLLGLQFPDPDLEEIETVKRVSRAVNSTDWHAKLCDGYGV